MNIKRLSVILIVLCVLLFSACRNEPGGNTTEPVTTSAVPTSEEVTIPDDGSGVGNVNQLIEHGILIVEDNVKETADSLEKDIAKTSNEVTEPESTEGEASESTPMETEHVGITPTESDHTVIDSTEPKNTEPTSAELPISDVPCCEYDKYLAMSPAEQEAYMRTFSDPMTFIQWSQNAEEEHKAHDDTIIVEGSELNIGDYIQ